MDILETQGRAAANTADLRRGGDDIQPSSTEISASHGGKATSKSDERIDVISEHNLYLLLLKTPEIKTSASS